MKHTRIVSSAAVLAMITLLALSMIAAPAAAGVVTGGDWEGDGTDVVNGFNASAENTSTVHYETNTTTDTLDDIEGLEYNISHDGDVLVELDKEDATIVSGSSDNTTALTVEFEVSHDELEKLPGQIGENVTTDVYIAELDANGDAINASESTFEVDFQFSDERSVMVVTSDSIDDADVGPSVESYDEEIGGFLGFGAEETTIYELEETRDINGSATTIYTYADDGDLADAFGESVAEEEGFFGAEAVDDGEPIPKQTMMTDDGLIITYANEAGDAVDEDADTYAIYHNDSNMMELHLGDEYDGEESVEVYQGSHSPNFDGIVENSEIAEVYGSELGFTDLHSAFNFRVAFDSFMLDDDEFLYGGLVMPFVVTGTSISAKRRSAVEA